MPGPVGEGGPALTVVHFGRQQGDRLERLLGEGEVAVPGERTRAEIAVARKLPVLAGGAQHGAEQRAEFGLLLFAERLAAQEDQLVPVAQDLEPIPEAIGPGLRKVDAPYFHAEGSQGMLRPPRHRYHPLLSVAERYRTVRFMARVWTAAPGLMHP